MIRALQIFFLSVACVLGFSSVASAASLQVTPLIGYPPSSVNCPSAQYIQGGVQGVGGGDRICYQAVVNVSDVRNAQVNVQLPSGVNYEGNFQVASVQGPGTVAASQTQLLSGSGQSVAVRIGAPNVVISSAQVIFRFSARAIHPEAGLPGENKPTPFFSQAFVGQTQNQFTGQVGVVGLEWARPNLGLQTTIASVNGATPSNPTNTTGLRGGDTVVIRTNTLNNGNKTAYNTGHSTTLPSGITCADVSNIVNGGNCSSGVVSWSSLPAITPNQAVPTSFTVVMPNTFRPADKLTFTSNSNTAYYTDTNLGLQGWNAYYIQPSSASINFQDTNISLTNTSESQPNNSSTTQATPGETVQYRANVIVPAGTRLKAGDKVSFSFGQYQTFGGGLSYVNDAGITTGSGFEALSSSAVLTLPTDFVASNSADKTLVVRFNTRVLAVASTVPTIAQTGTVTYGAKSKTSGVSGNNVVNPYMQAYIGGFGIAPYSTGQLSAQVYNASSGSTGYNTQVVINIPSQLTPTNSSGAPLLDGQTTANGFVWNENNHALVLSGLTLAPGQPYNIQIPIKASAQVGPGAVTITANTSSHYDLTYAQNGANVGATPGYRAENGATFGIY